MKNPFYSDIRLPWSPSCSSRKRRCAEAACLCADPAARRVTGGALCPGSFSNQLYR